MTLVGKAKVATASIGLPDLAGKYYVFGEKEPNNFGAQRDFVYLGPSGKWQATVYYFDSEGDAREAARHAPPVYAEN